MNDYKTSVARVRGKYSFGDNDEEEGKDGKSQKTIARTNLKLLLSCKKAQNSKHDLSVSPGYCLPMYRVQSSLFSKKKIDKS